LGFQISLDGNNIHRTIVAVQLAITSDGAAVGFAMASGMTACN
jgi:hypothetical protein